MHPKTKEMIELVNDLSAKKLGYQLIFEREIIEPCQIDPNGRDIRILFNVPISQVKIKFSISDVLNSLLIVVIENPNIKKDENPHMLLEEYLNQIHRSDTNDEIWRNSHDIPRVLEIIFDVFATDLKDILNGKKWVKVYRDYKDY